MVSVAPKPFVKWAGGKQLLAQHITSLFPPDFQRYFEPFLGGGSVLLAASPSSAFANDANAWLIDTYKAVRDNWKRVACILDALPNTRADFIEIRRRSQRERDLWLRAAYFIYLNKTCFRGLYRVNKKNEFNVPYGNYDRRYYDPENLEAVSNALAGVAFQSEDFELALVGTREGDFVYFDPPYYKLNGYSDFSRYTPTQFREGEHVRLAALCRELDAKGVYWLLSNSDTAFVRHLFSGFCMRNIDNRRDINLMSERRTITELLISNYTQDRSPIKASARSTGV